MGEGGRVSGRRKARSERGDDYAHFDAQRVSHRGDSVRPEAARDVGFEQGREIGPSVTSLKVQIVRFVDGHQPGFVECEFRDAKGELHVIRDKLPVLTTANLWSDSA